eukprot:767238-Hanusia_phi.AAC.1
MVLVGRRRQEGDVEVWSYSKKASLVVLEDSNNSVILSSMIFPHDASFAAAGTWDSSILVWSMATGKLVMRWRAHSGAVLTLDFSRERRMLASGRYVQAPAPAPAAPAAPAAAPAARCPAAAAAAAPPPPPRVLT